MSIIVNHRFTVREYCRMAETGVLKPKARVELLNGQIVDMSPIGPLHGAVVTRLNRLFTERANGRWTVSPQNSMALDDYSQPQPDLMILKSKEDDYAEKLPSADDIFLLIEVADSSLAYDRGAKLAAYGRAGIREVWIVNLEDVCIEINREPHYDGYTSAAVIEPGGQACPLAFPDMAVDVATLLR